MVGIFTRQNLRVKELEGKGRVNTIRTRVLSTKVLGDVGMAKCQEKTTVKVTQGLSPPFHKQDHNMI